MIPANDTCHSKLHIDSRESPLISAVMFAAGVFGNVAALALLESRRCREGGSGRGAARRRRRRRSLFDVLVTALVVTDLAGTCLVSPLVQVSYSVNMTLVGMSPSPCEYFGFAMTFFSLATMALLLAMALERCVAIGHPYFYGRHVTKKCAYVAVPFVFLACALFGLLPFAGFGNYVQYCPGTWCFLDMNPYLTRHRVYANMYASVMLALVLAIVACNGSVAFHLVQMYRRRRRRHGGSVTMATGVGSARDRRVVSLAEEVEHLILLVFMTTIFIICTLPLVVRVYINTVRPQMESHRLDLNALRFISINSIIDPWVFIFLSPSVLHFCWASVCSRPLAAARTLPLKLSLGKEACHPTSFSEFSQSTL